MACREFEMGRVRMRLFYNNKRDFKVRKYFRDFLFLQKKCERYFPLFGDEPVVHGPFRISCVSLHYIVQHASLSVT